MSRKLLSLVFSALLVLSLTACGGTPPASGTAPAGQTESPAPAETPAPTQAPATPEPTEALPPVEADTYYSSSILSAFNGTVEVTIGVTDGVIVSAEISAEEESLGGPLMRAYEAAVVEVGGADLEAIEAVDAITGATSQFTRDAVRAGLADCFQQAGLTDAA